MNFFCSFFFLPLILFFTEQANVCLTEECVRTGKIGNFRRVFRCFIVGDGRSKNCPLKTMVVKAIC